MDNVTLFGGKSQGQKKDQPAQAGLDDAMNMIRDVMRRLRQLEERHTNVRKALQLNEQNLLKQNKKTNSDIKNLEEDILELKKHIRSMGEEIKLLIKDAQDTVKKNDVKVLEKYIGFWQPLNYVTHNELEKEIKRIMKRESESQQESESFKR